jgi:ATP-dependent DNA ligase
MRYHNKLADSVVDAAFASGDWVAQEKIDGAWYMLEKIDDEHIYLFGRTKSKKTGELTEKSENVPHIIKWAKQLPDETVLIGEIFVPGGKSNDVTKIMGCTAANAIKRQTQTDEFGGLIHYYVFDCIRYDGIDLTSIGFIDRWNYLKNFEYSPQVHLSIIYDSDFESILSNIFIMGGEGMVFKRKDSVYEPDKRPMTCFKMKEHVDSVDLICMELLDPIKEYTGKELETWQYWIDGEPVTKHYYYGWKNAMRLGAYKDGKIIEVGRVASGLSDDIRADMAKNPEKYLNQVVQVSCMSLNKKDKTIRHPVFETMRYDKDINDCKLDEIFS